MTAYTAEGTSAADMSIWNTTRAGMDLMETQGGGITCLFFDQTGTGYATNAHNTVFQGKGYTVTSGSGGSGNGVLDGAVTGTKIWQFFVSKPYYGSPYTTMSQLSGDTTSKGLSGKPESAVGLLKHSNTANTIFSVDPVNNIIFCGDSQMFEDSDMEVADSRNTFGWAFRIWVAKAAQYGSSFTDMFIEDNQPGAVPAPWDEHWGDNALDLRDNNQDGRYGIRSTADDN